MSSRLLKRPKNDLSVILYKMGKLSSGREAELAGVPRVIFLQSLANYGATIIDLTKEELESINEIHYSFCKFNILKHLAA